MRRAITAVVLAAVLVVSLPLAVVAAVVWSREVQFGASEAAPGSVLLEWETGDTGCGTAGALYSTYGFESSGGTQPNFGGEIAVLGVQTCRLSTAGGAVTHFWTHTAAGTVAPSTTYQFTVQWCGENDAVVTLGAASGGTAQAHTAGGTQVSAGSAGTTGCQGGGAAWSQTQGLVTTGASDGALFFRSSRSYTYIRFVVVQAWEESVAGDCYGHAGAGTDGGLVWPSAGLWSSTHQKWGDFWYETPSSFAGGCRFERPGRYGYQAPEGMVAGDTWSFGVAFSALVAGTAARVQVSWVMLGGLRQMALDHTYTGTDSGGAAGPGSRIRNSNVPQGATYVEVYVAPGTVLESLYIANVEGDATLDDGSDGTGGPGPDTSGDPWADCEPGSDFLAVGEWVAYAACLIAGLPRAIIGLLVGILVDLFVPVGIGDAWSAFVDDVSAKVPFGWLAEAVDVLTAFLDPAIAGAAPPVTMVIMGATVAVDTSVTQPIEQFRPALVAIVYVAVAMGIVRLIRSTVGGSA